MSTKSVATTVRAAVLGMAAVAVWGLVPGCGGPSIGSYCDQVCECLGCSEKERSECTDALEDAKKAAEDESCGDSFNDYLSCVNEELECKDDEISADGCETEAEALAECAGGTSIGKNACELYTDEVLALYESCGVDVETGGGEPTECTEEVAAQAQCLRPCIDLLPCVCIDSNLLEQCTADVSSSYVDCVTACQ